MRSFWAASVQNDVACNNLVAFGEYLYRDSVAIVQWKLIFPRGCFSRTLFFLESNQITSNNLCTRKLIFNEHYKMISLTFQDRRNTWGGTLGTCAFALEIFLFIQRSQTFAKEFLMEANNCRIFNFSEGKWKCSSAYSGQIVFLRFPSRSISGNMCKMSHCIRS